MSDEYTCNGWACTDCLMLLANGEAPAGLSEAAAAKWQAGIDAQTSRYNITLGLCRDEHECATNYTVTDVITGEAYEYRADDATGALYAHSFHHAPLAATAVAHDLKTESDRGGECDCETRSFSWSACDVCGSSLGGERHGVSFWEINRTNSQES